jgi:tyrosine-specific transport protein
MFILFFAVPFGKIALGSMWKAAGTLILEQGAEKLGVFEWVSNVLNLQ